jgi:3-dehydroquinate dehydratase I
MICVSLAEQSLSSCLEALETLDFAEIRMDAMPSLTLANVGHLFSQPVRLIATNRPSGPFGNYDRKAMLMTAIQSGAAYVDIEVESEAAYRNEIAREARTHGCKVIVSFHDHAKTPERQELEAIVSSCFEAGADIAKVACTVHSDRDCARLLGLLDSPRQVVAIGMGEKGRITRIAAPLLGSPFTFTSLSKGKETAEGQIDKETLKHIWEVLSNR